MLVGVLPLLWRLSILLLASVAAGIANGVAGGGNFITFPTLLGLGIPALQANLSTSVGVVPSYVGSLRLYRHDLAGHRALIRILLPPCLVGTLTGCALLLNGSSSTFRSVVPYLIGAGTVLFGASPLITRALANVDHAHPLRRWTLYVGLFLISVYLGYLGAGIGILLLAVMALALPLEIHELQGLRNVLSLHHQRLCRDCVHHPRASCGSSRRHAPHRHVYRRMARGIAHRAPLTDGCSRFGDRGGCCHDDQARNSLVADI